MAGEYQTILSTLIQQPDNKLCADCSAPAPQWASVSYGIFVCLNCSGTHRSLGVHLSFVRSVTLDKWSQSQVDKMKLGGNAKWKNWCLEAGRAENYSTEMSIPVLYNTHFAAQYRDKLTAELEGRTWSPSDTPPTIVQSNPSSDASSTLRKPRTNLNTSSAYTSRSGSPASSSIPGSSPAANKKAENESYFASLGAANVNRSEALPPSQGGKYVGFGSNAGSPYQSSDSGSGWNDVPASAVLSKGWGLLSSTLSQLNDTVVRPAHERVNDSDLQSQVWSMASKFQKTVIDVTKVGSGYAAEGLKVASEQAKARGYDVGHLGSKHLEEFSKPDDEAGAYRAINSHDDGSYYDGDEDRESRDGLPDVGRSYTAVPTNIQRGAGDHHHQGGSTFDDWSKMAPMTAARQKSNVSSTAGSTGSTKARGKSASTAKIGTAKADDGWDEW